jgi:DNA-directed RNA polymerase subunit RPC12/RpoP
MNDDRSPLISLMSCMDCAKTMKLETIAPYDGGGDLLQYRCGQCGRIERLRLVRRSWP